VKRAKSQESNKSRNNHFIVKVLDYYQ